MIEKGGGKFRPSLFRKLKSKRALEQSRRLNLNYVFFPVIPEFRNTFFKVPGFTRLSYRLEQHGGGR